MLKRERKQQELNIVTKITKCTACKSQLKSRNF